MPIRPKQTTTAGKTVSDYTLVVERFEPILIRRTGKMSDKFTFRGDTYLTTYENQGYKFDKGVSQQLHALLWHLHKTKHQYRSVKIYYNRIPAPLPANFQPQIYSRDVSDTGEITLAVAPFVSEKVSSLLKSLQLL